MMKRILCILLAILLLTPAVFADNTMTLTLSQVEGEIGDKVTVVGKVENAPSCASYRVILTYDNTCLKPLSGKKGSGTSGQTAININAAHQGKSAIVAMAAKASQALIGNAELFILEFEIIGNPQGTNYTEIAVAYHEFFNEDLARVSPTVTAGKVTYPSLPVPTPPAGNEGETTTPPAGEGNNPGGETTTPPAGEGNNPGGETTTPPAGEGNNPGGETTTPPAGDGNNSAGGETTTPPAGGENNTSPDTPAAPENPAAPEAPTTPEGGATTGDSNTNAPAPEKEPEKNNNYKEPEGNWIVAGDQYAHVDNDGNGNLYQGEFKDEAPQNPGDKAEVILKDEEGKEAGSVIVEKEEDGTLNVVGEDFGKDQMPIWAWFLIGGGIVVLGAAAVVGYLYYQKKKTAVTE